MSYIFIRRWKIFSFNLLRSFSIIVDWRSLPRAIAVSDRELGPELTDTKEDGNAAFSPKPKDREGKLKDEEATQSTYDRSLTLLL